jgi:hypothetical protein
MGGEAGRTGGRGAGLECGTGHERGQNRKVCDRTGCWDGIGTPGPTLGRYTLILYRGLKLYRP